MDGCGERRWSRKAEACPTPEQSDKEGSCRTGRRQEGGSEVSSGLMTEDTAWSSRLGSTRRTEL